MALEPELIFLVGVEIVEHDMNVLAWIGGNDAVHELKELDATAALLMRGGHRPSGDFECGKQRRSAVPLIVVALAGQGAAVRQLQIALRPLQRLDGGLFIDTDDNGILRRGAIEANKPRSFGGKFRVVALAPRLSSGQVDLLSPKKTPDVLHADIFERVSQYRSRPARVALRRWPIQERKDALVGRLTVDRRLAKAAPFFEPFQAMIGKAAAPIAQQCA